MKNNSFDFFSLFKISKHQIKNFQNKHVLISLQKFIKFAFFMLAFEQKSPQNKL